MNDPYVYDNGVLKNKLGIYDYDELNRAEADIGFIKLLDIDSLKITNFNEESLKMIHEHIFEDIFDWAGKYRVMPLFKEELVGREPGSILSLEDEWKDHEKKKKLHVRAEFFVFCFFLLGRWQISW